ncbi:MAG: MurR/RpiR family transcriptional regulator, partial [Erysipelotrichaceae bacterium]|nr:MurR/RpiR family transcriptional regulator [Erysipelotrichaceae bacterium]
MKLNIDLPLHTLTSKELEILRYVLENSSDVESMSIQQLAENISYSTSTILRFCRKLGFKGYPELKFFLRNQIKLSYSTPSYQLSADSLSKIKTNIMTDLEGTGGLLNSDSLPQISALLNKNVTIYLHKPGGITDVVIDYLESILFIAGFRNVYKSTSKRTTSHLIKVAPKDAIFIFVSTSGSFSQTLNLAKEARLAGMQVISISSVESNDLAEISALNLRFFTKVRENSGA